MRHHWGLGIGHTYSHSNGQLEDEHANQTWLDHNTPHVPRVNSNLSDFNLEPEVEMITSPTALASEDLDGHPDNSEFTLENHDDDLHDSDASDWSCDDEGEDDREDPDGELLEAMGVFGPSDGCIE